MKIPKEIQSYCATCNKHTTAKIKLYKSASTRALAWGTRENVRKHKQGYGGKAEFNAIVKKNTKRPAFVAECNVCKKKHYFVIPKRMKKIEIVA